MPELAELKYRKSKLQMFRWRLASRTAQADPFVVPAALDWLDGEIEAIKKAIAAPTPQ